MVIIHASLTRIAGGALETGDLVFIELNTGALAGTRTGLAVVGRAAQSVAIITAGTQLTVVASRVVTADTFAWGEGEQF